MMKVKKTKDERALFLVSISCTFLILWDLILCQSWSQIVTLRASDAAASSRFGASVSITKNTALIGAPGADGGKGAAYLFSRSGNDWVQSPEIKRGAATSASFGFSVSLTDNYAAVGSPGFDGGKGAAYLFSISGNSWQDVGLTITVSTASIGGIVSLTNEFLVVGDENENNKQGAVYIYSLVGSVWSTQPKRLISPSGLAKEYFGNSFSINNNALVVGATGTPPCYMSVTTPCYGTAYAFTFDGIDWRSNGTVPGVGFTFADVVSMGINRFLVSVYYGSSHLYSRSGNSWSEEKKFELNAPIAIKGDKVITRNYLYAFIDGEWKVINQVGDSSVTSVGLSESCAIIGRGDKNSGIGEVEIIQSPATLSQSPSQSQSQSQSHSQSQSQSQSRSMSVSQSMSSSSTLSSVLSEVLIYNSARSGNFGYSIVVANSSLIASRPICNQQSNCDGGRAVMVQKNSTGDWVGEQVLKGRHRVIDALFGFSMAISNAWLAITSKATAYHQSVTSIVNIFSKNLETGTYERVAGLRPKSNNQTDMDYGISIAIGPNDAISGAPGFDYGDLANVGAIFTYRYRLALGQWGRNPAITMAYDKSAGDRFGYSISLDESFLAVGNNPSDPSRHAVYILTKFGFEFAHFQKIQSSRRGFGWAVLLTGDELVVSSPQDDNSGVAPNCGSVSTYTKNATNHFQELATIYRPPFVSDRYFGYVIARHQERLVIGTNTCANNPPCALKGKVYLYSKSGQQWIPLRSFASEATDGSDFYGKSVAVDEANVYVGAPNSNNGDGKIYIYSA